MNPYLAPGIIKPNERKIFKAVAKMYDIKPEEITYETREQPYCEARQYVIFLLKRRLKYTNKKAIEAVGLKEMATAIHASKVIKNRIELKQLWFQLKKQG